MEDSNVSTSYRVRVLARVRPLLAGRREERNDTLVVDQDKRLIKCGDSSYTYDGVFLAKAEQQQVFDSVGTPVCRGTVTDSIFFLCINIGDGTCSFVQAIEDLLKGYNTTIFSYGQTGSGKTHTMFGELDSTGVSSVSGLTPRITNALFGSLRQKKREQVFNTASSEVGEPETTNTESEYSVKCSYLELYNEVAQDLLSSTRRQLKIRENSRKGVVVEGLTRKTVSSAEDVLHLLELGFQRRKTISTDMNEQSSRSHAIFMLTLTQVSADGSSTVATLNLVDLAGSERVGRSNVTGSSLKEARSINQSLSALGNCIHALTDAQRSHIPYRDSKLTHVLKESLGGNTKTTLLINVSPAKEDSDESLSTLRFGACAKTIQNTIKINRELSPEELEGKIESLLKYISMIERTNKSLKEQLGKHGRKHGLAGDSKVKQLKNSENGSHSTEWSTDLIHVQAENKELQHKVSTLEEELENEHSQHKQEKEQFEQKFNSVLEISEEAASEIETLRTRCSTLKKQLASAMANASEAEVDAANQGMETQELKKQLEDANKEIERLKENVKTPQEKSENLPPTENAEKEAIWRAKRPSCNDDLSIEEDEAIASHPKSAWTSPRETAIGATRKAPRISMSGNLFRIPKVENIKQLSQALRERRTFLEVGESSESVDGASEQHQTTNNPGTSSESGSQLSPCVDFQEKRKARRESVRSKIFQRRQERQQGQLMDSGDKDITASQRTCEDQPASYADLSGRLQRTVQQLTLQSNRIRTLEGQLFSEAEEPVNHGECRSARSNKSASPSLEDSKKRKSSPPTCSRPSSVGDAPAQRTSSRDSNSSKDHNSSFMSRLKRTIYSRESASEDPSKPQSAHAPKGRVHHPDASMDETSSVGSPRTDTSRHVEDTRGLEKSKSGGGLLRKLKNPIRGDGRNNSSLPS